MYGQMSVCTSCDIWQHWGSWWGSMVAWGLAQRWIWFIALGRFSELKACSYLASLMQVSFFFPLGVVKVVISGSNKRVDWLTWWEADLLPGYKFVMEKGMRDKHPSCPAATCLTEGTFEGRESFLIVYQDSHRFIPEFCSYWRLLGSQLYRAQIVLSI